MSDPCDNVMGMETNRDITDSVLAENEANKRLLEEALARHTAGCPTATDGKHFWNEAGFCQDCDAEEPDFPSIVILCDQCWQDWSPHADEVGGWCPDCVAAADHQYRVDHAGPQYA